MQIKSRVGGKKPDILINFGHIHFDFLFPGPLLLLYGYFTVASQVDIQLTVNGR